MKIVYVTGSNGQLGREFCADIAMRQGRRVIAVSRQNLANTDELIEQRSSANLFSGDWYDSEHSDATILHTAGLSNPRALVDAAELTARHVSPHLEMVKAILRRGWRGRLLYTSSGGTIYGEAQYLPIDEAHPMRPESAYGLYKLQVECGLAQLSDEWGFELVNLRISNPYGARQEKDGQGVIPVLLNRIRTGQAFSVFGDGTAVRDYLHVEDLCEAVARSIDVPLSSSHVSLNISSGSGTSINYLIDRLQSLTNKGMKLEYQSATGNVQSNVLCNKQAHKVLGWGPKVDIEAGLKKYLTIEGEQRIDGSWQPRLDERADAKA